MQRKITINDVHNLAKQKNGKCSSKIYVNIDSKLKWECHAGHHWEASYYNVEKNGSWCPHCAGIAKLSLDAMKKLAWEKNGECLSTTYINSSGNPPIFN